jgi:hypothetical protein
MRYFTTKFWSILFLVVEYYFLQNVCSSVKLRIGAAGPVRVPNILPVTKLPVWPVYGGVFAQLSDWLGGKNILTDKILDSIGGRVVPMTLSDANLSPFLLLVHHCHSFLPFDPVRAITRLILPEGFPAHPHSGFSTGPFLSPDS